MTAPGATPAQARRVVLANGLVLGSVAALAGVGLGIAAAAVALPIGQRFSGDRFGPFDVAWLDLTVIGLFGLLSALLAAVVPAWIASRQDVVAVLAGRRGDRAAGLRSPLVACSCWRWASPVRRTARGAPSVVSSSSPRRRSRRCWA